MPVVLRGQQLPRGPLQKGRANPAHTAPMPSRVPFGIARGHPELGPHPTSPEQGWKLPAEPLLPCLPTSEAAGGQPHSLPSASLLQKPPNLQRRAATDFPPSSTSCCFLQSYPKTSSGTATPGHSQVLHTDPHLCLHGGGSSISQRQPPLTEASLCSPLQFCSLVHSDIPDRVPPWPRCFPQPFN